MSDTVGKAQAVHAFIAKNYPGREAEGLRQFAIRAQDSGSTEARSVAHLLCLRFQLRGLITIGEAEEVQRLLRR